jgi:DNA-binding LytR/AlgR family response regulator
LSTRLIRWLAYLGGWTLFALFFISEDAGQLLSQGRTVQWHGFLVVWLTTAYAWAFLTPFVWWLASRFPIERTTWRRSAGLPINGKQAAGLMLTGGFDLIFLDVQMPEMDGIAALRRGGELPGAVIFVTAYDQYAVEAFEVNAADYLLKPFTPQRFRKALQRAKARILSGSPGLDARVLSVLERIASQPTYLNRIAVRGTAGTSFVETKDVEWVKAAENYVELHVGPDCYLIEVTMAEIAKRLDCARFVRIHLWPPNQTSLRPSSSIPKNSSGARTIRSASAGADWTRSCCL